MNPELEQMATDFGDTAAQLEAEGNNGLWSASLKAVWEVLEKYQEMVVRDPELTSKLEAAFRVASYIIPGIN